MAAVVAAQVQVGFGKSRFGFVQPWVWRDTILLDHYYLCKYGNSDGSA